MMQQEYDKDCIGLEPYRDNEGRIDSLPPTLGAQERQFMWRRLRVPLLVVAVILSALLNLFQLAASPRSSINSYLPFGSRHGAIATQQESPDKADFPGKGVVLASYRDQNMSWTTQIPSEYVLHLLQHDGH